MDADTLYKLMKPHLDLLNSSEKKSLSKLINYSGPVKITCHHRKIRSFRKAKEHLKKFCLEEMEKERNGHHVL